MCNIKRHNYNVNIDSLKNRIYRDYILELEKQASYMTDLG